MSEQRTWPDLAGRIEGKRHILPVRVYFEDTDFSGLVYHGSYVRWCERGRSDWLRLLGLSHQALHASGDGQPSLVFVVRHIDMTFRKPARIDDVLEVATALAEWGGASLTLAQSIARDEVELMRAQVQVVLISTDGRPHRLPPELIDALRG